MKSRRLEQIAKLVVDCESRAETPDEYELLHQIYLDCQAHYKRANGKYMQVREYKPSAEVSLEGLEVEK